MAEPVDPARVIAEHQQLQELQGDCLSDGAQPRLPSKITVSFPRGDLTIQKEIWRKKSAEGRQKFQSRYGDIALLLGVQVDESML